MPINVRLIRASKLGIILRNGGAVVAAVSLAVTFGLDVYLSTFPTVADPEHGLTSRHNLYGHIHYVTPQLQTAFNWAFNIGFYSVVPIAVGIYLLREQNSR